MKWSQGWYSIKPVYQRYSIKSVYQRVMSRKWTGHITYTKYEFVMEQTQIPRVMSMCEPCHTYEQVMPRLRWLRKGENVGTVGHVYARGM